MTVFMIKLILLKERVIEFYNKNEVFITPILKFLLALLAILVINAQLGYLTVLNNSMVVLIAALMCSFLPYTLMLCVLSLFCLGHFYAIGLETLLVGFVGFVLLAILFLKFVGKETVVLIITPILCLFQIPYVMPIAMGLLGTPFSVVSVGCGVVIYYIIYHVQNNASVLASVDADAIQKIRVLVDAILADKSMLIMLLAFTLALLTVHTIRRMQLEYAWTVAMIGGYILCIIILLVGDFLFDTNISGVLVFVGVLVSFFVTKAIEFFGFHLDYSRTESVQFEDDEYYYYVKAVPKITVGTPQRKVKKITTQQQKVQGRSSGKLQSRSRTRTQPRTNK